MSKQTRKERREEETRILADFQEALKENSGEAQKEEESFSFRPVGYGAQKVEELLLAAETAGSAWLIVEQDSPSMGKSSLECAKMSIEYLKKLMNRE